LVFVLLPFSSYYVKLATKQKLVLINSSKQSSQQSLFRSCLFLLEWQKLMDANVVLPLPEEPLGCVVPQDNMIHMLVFIV